jgi:Haem-binding domain
MLAALGKTAKIKTKIASAVLLALGLAQLIPVTRTNPPVEAEVEAPEEVLRILRNSCYDCHSHESRWPWYAHVAPVSWLVAHDVNEAREQLNFSTWDAYGAKERADHLEEIWEEVDEGEMPLWFYLPLHPEARLSDADKNALRAWTLGAR